MWWKTYSHISTSNKLVWNWIHINTIKQQSAEIQFRFRFGCRPARKISYSWIMTVHTYYTPHTYINTHMYICEEWTCMCTKLCKISERRGEFTNDKYVKAQLIVLVFFFFFLSWFNWKFLAVPNAVNMPKHFCGL